MRSDDGRAGLEAAQAHNGGFKCLASAGKVEAKTLAPRRRIRIEARARHRGNAADRLRQQTVGDRVTYVALPFAVIRAAGANEL